MRLVMSGVVAAMMLTGCQTSSVAPQPVVEAQAIISLQPVTHPQVLSTEQIFSLTDAQREDFLTFFNAPAYAHIEEHKRLVEYLERRLFGFDYRGDTYTAAESLTNNGGNCMSLAILTTALANLAGIDIEYNVIFTTPVYWQKGNTLLLSSHVNVMAHRPKKYELFEGFGFSGVVIDYYPDGGDVKGKRVNFEQMLAFFYQNHAVEALLANDYTLAIANAQRAYQLDPTNPETLNLLAVTYRRMGANQQAGEIFRFATEHNLASINLINNYALYARLNGDAETAVKLDSILEEADDPNPYAWVKLGFDALSQKDASKARHYFKVALRHAPYLAEAHFGIAQSYYLEDSPEQAVKAMERAVSEAFDTESRQRYREKLSVLRSVAGES